MVKQPSRSQRAGLGLCSLAFIAACSGNLVHAQSPYDAGLSAHYAAAAPLPYNNRSNYNQPYYDPRYYDPNVAPVPNGYNAGYAGQHAGGPVGYDPALVASYYQLDLAAVEAASQGYDPFALIQDPRVAPTGFSASGGMPNGQYAMSRAETAALAGGNGYASPYDIQQAQATMPTLGYSGATISDGQYNIYGNADPANPSGGFRFAPAVPPWIKGFETGFYGNEDQVLFSVGGIFALRETDEGAIAGRALATAIINHDGPARAGVTLDLYMSRRVQFLGFDHLVKGGFFYDQQNVLRRYGFELGGIFMTNTGAPPFTFDMATGFGDGDEFLGGKLKKVSDVDVQMRFGLMFYELFRVGATLQYYHWNDPLLEPTIWAAGGYAQLNLGTCLMTFDLTTTDRNVQGFLTFTFQPGPRPRRSQTPPGSTIAQADWTRQYQSWMTQPVLRDIALRTGNDRLAPAVGAAAAGSLVGSITNVSCVVRFPGGTTGADNGNGVVDPGEGFEVDIVLTNGTTNNAVLVAVQGINASPTATIFGNATQVGAFGISGTTVAAGGSVTQTLGLNVDATAAAGDRISFIFEVAADGQRGRFRCGPFTVGQIQTGATDSATFLGLVSQSGP